MNNQIFIFTGIMVLLIVGTIFTFKDSNYEANEHYLQIEKKDNKDGIYYVTGKDPYIHNAQMLQIFVDSKEYNELKEQEIYYIKYKTDDGKIYKLTNIEYQK